jgi:hypothetical protein
VVGYGHCTFREKHAAMWERDLIAERLPLRHVSNGSEVSAEPTQVL